MITTLAVVSIIRPHHKCKFPGVVVHSAAVHEGSHVEHVFGVEDLLGRDGTHAAVGNGRCDNARALACQLEGAELRVIEGVNV